jgi:hypothetical protein
MDYDPDNHDPEYNFTSAWYEDRVLNSDTVKWFATLVTHLSSKVTEQVGYHANVNHRDPSSARTRDLLFISSGVELIFATPNSPCS